MIPQNSLGWLIDPTGKWTRRNSEFTMTGLFAFRHRTGWAVGLVKCRTPKLLVFVWNRWSAAEWSRWERHLLNLGHVFIGQMVSQDDSIWLVVWNIFSIYWDHPNWLIILFRDFQRGWNHQPGMIRKIPDSGSRHGSEWFLYYESQRPSSCPCLVNLQVLGLWWMLRIDNSHKTTYKVWIWTWTRYIWADCNHILWVLYCCFSCHSVFY